MSQEVSTDIYAETLAVFDEGEDPYEPLTTPEVAEALDCARRTVYKRLETLVERGELQTKEAGANARVWWRSPAAGGTRVMLADQADVDEEARRRLDLFENVEDIADVGAWQYDVEADQGWWTEQVSRIHGLPLDYVAAPEESMEYYHPDDRDQLREAFERAVENQEPYDLELRLIDTDGEVHWVRTRGEPEFEGGELVRIQGTLQDITERKEHERDLEQYRILTRTASNVILTTDQRGTIQDVNPAVSDVFGYEPEELHDESIATLFPDVTGDDVQAVGGSLSDRSGSEYVELTGRHAGGTEIPVAVSFSEYEHNDQQYVTGIVRDLSDQAERDRLRRLERLNAAIRTIGKVVVQADTRAEIVETACDTLLEFEQYRSAVIGELSPSFERFEQWARAGPDDIEALFADMQEVPPADRFGVTATKSGDLQVYRDGTELPSARCSALEDVASCAAIPIGHETTVYGIIGVCADQPAAFDEETRAVLEELGEIVGYALHALERKEVLDRATEVEFQSEWLAESFPEGKTIELELDSIVSRGAGTNLEYWTVKNMDANEYQRIIEQGAAVRDVRLLGSVGSSSRFEIASGTDSIAPIMDQFDGRLKSVIIDDGVARLVAELPETTETAEIVRRIRETIPDLELTARRRVLTPTYLRRLTEAHLTDRQLTVLKTAYFAGYFRHPRLSTGTELADRLDITRQTFHHHLRKAEHGVLRQLFETPSDTSP